jgi:pimeloyl-ACP methyl ester carboxylesterase
MASKREAFRNGPRGFAFELALGSRPWGFPLQAIRVPVHVWHGELDVSTPIAMARCLAAAIPTSRARFFPACGHFLSYEVWPEILLALMGCRGEIVVSRQVSGGERGSRSCGT